LARPSLVVYDDIGGNVRQVIGYEEGREAAQPFDQPTPVDAINAALVDEIFIRHSNEKHHQSPGFGKHGPQRTGRPQPAGGHHPHAVRARPFARNGNSRNKTVSARSVRRRNVRAAKPLNSKSSKSELEAFFNSPYCQG